MKIWAILYIAGQAAVVVGPLPVKTIEQCNVRIVEQENEIDKKFAMPERVTKEGIILKRSDFVWRCEISDTRPPFGIFPEPKKDSQ